MIDLISVSENELSQTMRSIRGELIARGWQAKIPYVGSPHCFITRSDGKALHIFSATPPTTSYAAAHLANDKYATYQVIADTDIPQSPTMLVKYSQDSSEAIKFMKEHGLVVVKPLDAGHGKGITVNISTEPQLEAALEEAKISGHSSNNALVQAQYKHEISYDLRLLCIDFTYCAAILRVPARVRGDGIHTVRELIDLENESGKRGKAYYAPLATIDINKAQQYLGKKVDEIPAQGADVRVLGIANYGAGGETIDVTDLIPQALKDYAVKASQLCELPVAGVDFLLSEPPHPGVTLSELDPILIEINKCPLLTMHDHPTSGKSRHVVARYMDYLTNLDA